MSAPTLPGVDGGSSAVIDGIWRYSLTRQWEAGRARRVTWIMLNPSTADAEVDDPTIARCRAFSASWGFGQLTVVNLYAYRATVPAKLWVVPHLDRVGPDNDTYIVGAALGSQVVVAAWGANARMDRDEDRAGHVQQMLAGLGRPLWCLAVNRDGSPKHPLYVRGDTPLVPYPGKEQAK